MDLCYILNFLKCLDSRQKESANEMSGVRNEYDEVPKYNDLNRFLA